MHNRIPQKRPQVNRTKTGLLVELPNFRRSFHLSELMTLEERDIFTVPELHKQISEKKLPALVNYIEMENSFFYFSINIIIPYKYIRISIVFFPTFLLSVKYICKKMLYKKCVCHEKFKVQK